MAEFDWNSEEFQRQTTKEIGWYKCLAGFKDIIRIISKPHAIMRHNWGTNNSFQTSLCSKEKYGSCPVCSMLAKDPNHKYQKVYSAAVLHILRKPNAGKAEVIGKLLAWRFGDDKKNAILEQHSILAMTGKTIFDADLQIAVDPSHKEGEKMQKLLINRLDENVLPKFQASKEHKAHFAEQMSEENLKKILAKFYPSPDQLKASVKDLVDDAAASFDPADMDSLVEESKPTKKVKSAPVIEEETEDDDSLADLLK
jgi:hypothetical protein